MIPTSELFIGAAVILDARYMSGPTGVFWQKDDDGNPVTPTIRARVHSYDTRLKRWILSALAEFPESGCLASVRFTIKDGCAGVVEIINAPEIPAVIDNDGGDD